MNRTVSSLHLAATVTLTLGCAPKPCDETKLEKIAAATGDRSLTARDARNAAIVEACPKLPVGLARALEQSFASEYDWVWGAPSRHDDREYRRVAPSAEAALASFEAKREELLACVIADHGTVARLNSDSRLSISWGPLPASGAVGIAVLVGSRDESAALQACVARVLGVVSAPDERFLDFAMAIELELSSPIRIAPRDAE